jgi:hypothetical protein
MSWFWKWEKKESIVKLHGLGFVAHRDGASRREPFKQFYTEMYMDDGRRTMAQFPMFPPNRTLRSLERDTCFSYRNLSIMF